MKIEKKDKSSLFSSTEISDIFFTEYLPLASDNSIKVYLFLIFSSKYNTNISLGDLSKKLNLPLQSIQSSIDFWEELGLITKTPNGVILNDIQDIELHKVYSFNTTLSKKDVEKNSKNKYRSKAIESINNMYFQGIMSPAWYSDIDLWFKKYDFDEQVMIALFDYCFNKSALHKNYVQAVADAWFKNKIKTYNNLETYYQKYEYMSKIKKDIAKKLKRYSPLTQYEEAFIEKWIVDFNYNLDIINIALKKTTSKAQPSFDYIDKLLSDWNERGFKSISEIEKFLSEFKQKKKNIKELEKKTNYNNCKKRTYDDLNELYSNKN